MVRNPAQNIKAAVFGVPTYIKADGGGVSSAVDLGEAVA
jgi:hypothetical protein